MCSNKILKLNIKKLEIKFFIHESLLYPLPLLMMKQEYKLKTSDMHGCLFSYTPPPSLAWRIDKKYKL